MDTTNNFEAISVKGCGAENSNVSYMTELSSDEVELVSGGAEPAVQVAVGAASGTAAATIGFAAFGTSWGSVGIGIAFAASPLAVVAIVGLTAVAAYSVTSAAISA